MRNAVKCLLCNDVIESKYVHDYKHCKCGNAMVDGGLDYIRRSVREMGTIQDLSEDEDYLKALGEVK